MSFFSLFSRERKYLSCTPLTHVQPSELRPLLVLLPFFLSFPFYLSSLCSDSASACVFWRGGFPGPALRGLRALLEAQFCATSFTAISACKGKGGNGEVSCGTSIGGWRLLDRIFLQIEIIRSRFYWDRSRGLEFAEKLMGLSGFRGVIPLFFSLLLLLLLEKESRKGR